MNLLQIDDNAGLVVDLLDYGARIVQINFKTQKLACAYDRLDDYLSDRFYLGASIGPICNRVQHGRITVAGKSHQMPLNENGNTLHSGRDGLDKQVWTVQSVMPNSVEFQLDYDLSKAGLQGQLHVIARYSVEQGVLRVEYEAQCDRETYLSLTNHVYLNLSGRNQRITDHDFEIFADSFIHVTDEGIPTGSVTELQRNLQYNIDNAAEFPEFDGSIDRHFNVGNPLNRDLKRLLNVRSSMTGIKLEVLGNSPGFQLYTGAFLSTPFIKSAGFCVETQFAPDAINQADFYSPTLQFGETLQQTTEYRFSQPKS